MELLGQIRQTIGHYVQTNRYYFVWTFNVPLLNIQRQTFLGEDGWGENGLSLLEQSFLVVDAGAEVSDDEAFGLCVSGHCGSLACGAVTGLGGTQGKFLGVGGFVLEEVGSQDELGQLRQVARIGAIGVGACWGCRCGKPLVGQKGAVGRCP